MSTYPTHKLAARALPGGKDEVVAIIIKSCKSEYEDRLGDVSDNVRRELNEAVVDSDPTIRIITDEKL